MHQVKGANNTGSTGSGVFRMGTVYIKKYVYWIGGIVLLLMLSVVGFVWFALLPKGELRLAMEKTLLENKDYRSAVSSIFNQVSAHVSEVAKWHANLSFQPADFARHPVPAQPLPGAVTLRDVLSEFVLGGKYEDDSATLSLSVDGIALLELLYGITGRKDFFLVVSNFDVVECEEGDRPAAPEETCYKMTSSIHDIDRGGRTFRGTASKITQDLAVYLFTEFWRQHGLDQRTENFLSASEISRSFHSLERTVFGFEYLEEGMAHPNCTDGRWWDCFEAAKAAFEEALGPNGDPCNASANLGLGILLLREAMDAAHRQSATIEVQRLLDRSIRKITAARQRSRFVQEKLEEEDWVDRFRLVKSGSFKIEPHLLSTSRYYTCMMHAYLEGEYSKQLTYTERLEGLPPEFEPYIQGYRYDALLRLASDNAEADKLLSELDDIRRGAPKIWIYNCIYGSQACRWDPGQETGKQVLRRARTHARWPGQKIEAEIRFLECEINRGLAEAALQKAKRVEVALEAMDLDQEELERLCIELGFFFAIAGDYDAAADHLIRAASSPFVLTRVLNAPELENFRNSSAFTRFQDEALKLRKERPPEFLCTEDHS